MEREENGNLKREGIFDNPAMQHFIKLREIKSEDFDLIEELAKFPKDLMIREMHNFFTSYRSDSPQMLQKILELSTDEKIKAMYQAFADFALKYDFYACHHLERVLEGEI